MFPFGSGLRQPNKVQNPSPSAPTVSSFPDNPGRSIQMSQPFGSGIGFKPQVVNPSNYQTVYSNTPQVPPYPPMNNSTPSTAHYQNYAQSNFYQTQNNIYPNLSQLPQPYNPQMPSANNFAPKGTPTVLPYDNFDPQVDAANLRKAMKGFGCDEKALIEILCRRNNQQRMEIAKVFKTNFGKDLIENIQSETRGNFENLLVALMTPTLDFYCKEIKDAMAGIGTDEQVLIEILCTLSNYEISLIKAQYTKLYGQNLESDIIGETSGSFKRLLVSLCTANRDESGETDIEKAKADATALLRAGELMFGTDESVFNAILCQKNYQQLKLIFQEYEKMTGHSFEQAIKNEFSGDIKDGFKAIFRCVNNKAEFFAHQLMKSMKGIGTNDRQLIRLVVTRCEIDMVEIKEAFARLFDETLKDCIKGDTSGDYKHALYVLIGENKS